MLLPFFEWCEATTLGVVIRESLWLFPVIEALHLLALATIGGAVLIVDLRLLGFGLRSQPIIKVAQEARPWLLGSLSAILLTGVMLFVSEALKCYYNPAFWFKMGSLALAILFTSTVHRTAVLSEDTESRPVQARLVAVVSVLLWTGVGVGGRAIGFY